MQKAGDFARIFLMQKAESQSTTMEEMFEVGAHYGYSKTRRHPSVASYIYATKNRTDIIDLEKTSFLLDKALEFVKKLGAQNKVILWVGTKPEAKDAIKSAAESLNMPYINERWIGGTLRNFSEIKKRIDELENYQKESAAGGLEKYTKKERLMMAKKMEKLSKYYFGLLNLKKIPDALFIVDTRAECIAATESQKSNIPIIALANSDSNIKNIDYPIICNDAAIPSIKLFTASIVKAYKTGQLSASSEKPPSIDKPAPAER